MERRWDGMEGRGDGGEMERRGEWRGNGEEGEMERRGDGEGMERRGKGGGDGEEGGTEGWRRGDELGWDSHPGEEEKEGGGRDPCCSPTPIGHGRPAPPGPGSLILLLQRSPGAQRVP